MTLNTWLIFAGAIILLTASPGPNALLALTHGVRHGASRAAATVAGSLVAFMILLGVSLAGVGAILTASATAFQILKWVGAAYLIFLGIRTWRSEPKSVAGEEPGEGKPLRRRRDLFRDGFLVAISNPKIIMFFAAFFPQFISPGAAWLPQVAVLALTFVALEAMWQLAYTGGGSKMARWLDESGAMRWFNRVTGGLFVGAGLLVLLSKK